MGKMGRIPGLRARDAARKSIAKLFLTPISAKLRIFLQEYD